MLVFIVGLVSYRCMKIILLSCAQKSSKKQVRWYHRALRLCFNVLEVLSRTWLLACFLLWRWVTKPVYCYEKIPIICHFQLGLSKKKKRGCSCKVVCFFLSPVQERWAWSTSERVESTGRVLLTTTSASSGLRPTEMIQRSCGWGLHYGYCG